MIDGIINVYKEQGYTSFDVVAKLRGILKQKKIGHTGTLDPMAEGVLVVCLGKATKLVDLLSCETKEYRTEMKLGIATDTEDITGTILRECDKDMVLSLDKEQVFRTIKAFEGEYAQIPPMYSALKKDGKKLYEYARKGIEVERESRNVSIYSIENVEINLPYVSFDVHCSKGTYIRSLCRDIGEKLGICACMTSLTRRKVHGFKLEDAYKLSEIEEMREMGTLDTHILPLDAFLKHYQAITIKNESEKLLLNGNKLNVNDFDDNLNHIKDGEIIRVYFDNAFIALYQYHELKKEFKPYKMFL